MHNLLIFTLLWAISSAADTPCPDSPCPDSQHCVFGRCISIPSSNCVQTCADREMCINDECMSMECDDPCADSEQCIAGQCFDMNAVLPEVGITDTVCIEFEHCEEYTTDCQQCAYDPIQGTTTCNPLQTACSADNPPAPQCNQCINGYELADGLTCCVISESLRLMGVEASMMELSSKIDTDADGYISKTEFDNFCNLLANVITHEEANELFAEIDTNRNQMLSEAELEAYFLAQLPQQPDVIGKEDTGASDIDASLRNLFDQIDADNSGYIERDEFDGFMSGLADDRLTDERADAFFNDIDKDNDGMLSREEVLNAYLRELIPERKGTDIERTDVIGTDGTETDGSETETDENKTLEAADANDASDADAMGNDGDNIPDMFGIKDATPAETYSILTVIIIAGIVILVVLTWGIYQYAQKRKAVKELNEMEENQNKMNEIDEKPLYETEIVTETRD